MNASMNPTDAAVAALYDAHLTIGMLLAGTFGDADPGRLLDAAIASLQAARTPVVECN